MRYRWEVWIDKRHQTAPASTTNIGEGPAPASQRRCSGLAHGYDSLLGSLGAEEKGKPHCFGSVWLYGGWKPAAASWASLRLLAAAADGQGGQMDTAWTCEMRDCPRGRMVVRDVVGSVEGHIRAHPPPGLVSAYHDKAI